MSFNDLVKYVTQQFVSYLDKSKDQRLQTKNDRRSSQPALSRWFGIIPLGFMLFMRNRKK
ncbi:YqzE family protein [Bacillus sp. DJP31]|uniref:YqzE family protein n=1 Tax=Bacillus sp. DJP31 TaxID=3409789 RepID=UPI003BB7CE11